MPYEPYMLKDCPGCSKQTPALCCAVYADPSKLIWIRQGLPCPMNLPVDKASPKEKFVNPQKASKREARMRKAK